MSDRSRDLSLQLYLLLVHRENSGQEHLVLAADQTSKKDRAFDCRNMKQLSLEETEQTSNQHAHATTVLCAGVFVFDGLSTFSRRP